MAENPGFKLNADNIVNRLIRSRRVCLPVAALFLLSGQSVNADPVGDFFKKVGQSISKAFQPQPTPIPSKFRKLSSLSRRRFQARRRRGSLGDLLPGNQTPQSRRRLHSKSHRSLLKKSSLLLLCCRLRPHQREKQKEICPTEFRSPGEKAWSRVLIYRREITSMSALLPPGPL